MTQDIREQNRQEEAAWIKSMRERKKNSQEKIESDVAERDESMSFNAGIGRDVFVSLIGDYNIKGATTIANIMARNPKYDLEAARKLYESLNPSQERKDTGQP